jgi:hypothetical protein
VRLGDVGDGDAEPPGEGEHPVDVALRIDDDRDTAVVCQVGAVTERGGLHHLDVDRRHRRSRGWGPNSYLTCR